MVELFGAAGGATHRFRRRRGGAGGAIGIGFGGGFVALLIFAESLGIALLGAGLGIALTFPVAQGFANAVGALLSSFAVSRETVMLQLGAALVVGVVAAAIPAWRAARIRIVDGLRTIG